MDSARLVILALSALLSTTLEPFGSEPQSSVALTREVAQTALTSTVETASEKMDREIADQILDRLSLRHTALSQRERIALVQAILREARAQNLDPSLVVAVIEVESGGYHLAVSRVGAMGLMQLLPATGKELADQMNIEWKGPDTLFDPIINVKLGTAYLHQLADRYGNVDTALAAYNWGPGRIDQRLRRGASVPSRYVERVMRVVDRNTTAAGRS